MRKSENISKYVFEWQLLRANIKGSKVSIEDKITRALAYFQETCSMDRYERVYNWLEGLEKGYAGHKTDNADKARALIKLAKSGMVLNYELTEKIGVLNRWDGDENLSCDSAGVKELMVLWKDLFRTNERWLKKGYAHKECNDFMDWMLERRFFDIWRSAGDRYNKVRLDELRMACNKMENTHKFFF